MKRSVDILTSHHSGTSSVPQISSSLATFDVLIYPWTTAEHSDWVWPPYWGTRTTDQADLAKLGSARLNLMSLHSTLVWQLPTTEHKIGRRGGCSWKWQRSPDKPHDDDDDESLASYFLLIFFYLLLLLLNFSFGNRPAHIPGFSFLSLFCVIDFCVLQVDNWFCCYSSCI